MSDPQTPQDKPPIRLWRRIGLMLGGIVVLSAVGAFIANRVEQARTTDALRALIETLDQDDPHWRLADIYAQREVIPDEENSARIIVAVAAAVPGPSGSDDMLTHTSPEPQERLDPKVVEALQQQMAPFAAVLAQARRLADMPRGRFHVTPAFVPIGTLMNEVQDSRQTAAVLRWDAMHLAEQGDIDAALRSGRGAINTARAVGDEPFAIAQLIRCSALFLACEVIERVLAQGEASEKELAALQHLLHQEDQHPTLRITARGERAIHFDIFDKMASGAVTREMIHRDFGVRPQPQWQAWISPRVNRRDQVVDLEQMTEYVASASRPAADQVATERRLDADSRMPKVSPVLVPLLKPELEQAGDVIRRKTACVRCLLAVVALERYRKAVGAWPESLAQLTPKYLAELLLDPFDGKPLRYTKSPDGVMVYSVGKNGTDDGGKVWPRPGPDEGYRLWDVSKRRQPARPALGANPP